MNKKKYTSFAIILLTVFQSLYINDIFAADNNTLDYKSATSIEQLCAIALNFTIEQDWKWCVVTANNYSTWTLEKISVQIKWKEIKWTQLLNTLTKTIESKYTKVWVKWTWLARAKETFFNNLLTAVWSAYKTTKIQNDKEKKDLYSALYIVLSVWRFNAEKEYSDASNAQTTNEAMNRYWTVWVINTSYIRLNSWEVVEINNDLLKTDEVKAIINSTTYQAPNKNEMNTILTRYVSTLDQLNWPAKVAQKQVRDYTSAAYDSGWFTTWISQDEIESAIQARASAETKKYESMTKIEQQLYKYWVPMYSISSPKYDVWQNWKISYLKASIERVKTNIDWKDYSLIKNIVKNDANVYIWLMIDWWLVKYKPELVKQTMFYQQYVSPFYWDTDWTWKQWTTNWQNAEKVLNYFWYKIDLDEMSPNYLNLTYDASNNQAIWQIEFIK